MNIMKGKQKAIGKYKYSEIAAFNVFSLSLHRYYF